MNTLYNIILLLFCCAFLFACTGEWDEYPVTGTISTIAADTVEIGDQLNIIVFEQDNLSGLYEVMGDGSISMPLIGNVNIYGLKSQQVSEVVRLALVEGGFLVNPTVSVTNKKLQNIYVAGEVINAGQYAYQSNMTVLDAVTRAGGFSYRANQNRFDIIRKKVGHPDTVIQADLSTRLKSGDLVRVRERYF